MMTMISGKGRIAKAARGALAVAAVLLLATADASARAGKGSNSGSRGSQSQSAPPPTNTAPRQAQPLPGQGQQGMASSVARQTPAQGSRWGAGLMGGLMGGLLGAGLFGLLSGSGFLSGLGSFMGFLGLLLQVALIAIVAKLAFTWWRNRQAKPAMAGGEPVARQPMQPDWSPMPPAMGAAPAAAPAPLPPLEIGGEDFAAFQQRLSEVQEAYGRGDRITLSRIATAEMANRFNEELDHDARQNAVNRISNVTLLQGDLAEAWREEGAEYATVAMRYSLIDVTLDKTTNKVLAGDAFKPQEATEIWTFVRDPGAKADGWVLSAIQQA